MKGRVTMKHLVMSLAVVGLLAGGGGCLPAGSGGPQTPRDKRFAADGGEDVLAGEGDAVTLRASAVNGTEPFIFRWNVERTPEGAEDVTLINETSAETTTNGPSSVGNSLDQRTVQPRRYQGNGQ